MRTTCRLAWFHIGCSLLLAAVALRAEVDLKGKENRMSYAIGADIARGFKQESVPINLDAFTEGVSDGLKGKLRMTQEEMQEAVQSISREIQERKRAEFEKEQEKYAEQTESNKTSGPKFMEENKGKDGVTTTASGLQYVVVKEADGPKPKLTDMVKVHYTGKLVNGTVFDSSVERGEPATFPLNGVIQGWQEGLQLMPVGAKYRFYIPPQLAYKEAGSPPQIPGNAVLIFDVELLEINPPEP